jgi:ubiquitin-conjugating enzyme E2 O
LENNLPAGFEEFVRDHFRRRGQHVIRACEAYQDGCLVGTLDEEGHPMKDSKRRPCSAGFKLALVNVLPRLVEALANIGAQGCMPS